MKEGKTVITPPHGLSLRLNELWRYRELFYFFTWRDIKVKYKQTTLGIAWAVLQPLALMVLFTLVFSRNGWVTNTHMPYPVFVLSGLVLWNFFYAGVSQASQGIIEQANVIKKIYFPRLVIPISALLAALFDFAIAFLLFLACCLLFRQPFQWSAILLFPAALLLVFLSAFGMGTLLSALTVKFRDFRYVLPFLLQFLFFATTVLYSLDSINQQGLKWLLALNPLNGAIELFRGGLGNSLNPSVVAASVLSSLLLATVGLLYFRKTEAYFADLA